MFEDVGGYKPWDIEVVAAWDIDKRKVGKDVSEAIYSPPNCTAVFEPDVPKLGVKVRMGKVLDGFADHMKNYPEDRTFVLAKGYASRHTYKLRSGRFRKSSKVLCGSVFKSGCFFH